MSEALAVRPLIFDPRFYPEDAEAIASSPTSWHSYPKIWTLGHRAIKTLFDSPVNVEEKVDGSQFSFGKIRGEIRVKSKGAEMIPEAPEKMFSKAVKTVLELDRQGLLHPEWTYRGEYLARPKHNSLVYDRVPTNHIIIFDVCVGEEEYLSYDEKAAEAARLGLEVVPLLATVQGNCLDVLRNIIDTTLSCLGGQKIEGVVCKQVRVSQYGDDKKALIGKFVGEAFKEIHRKSWGESNPGARDIVTLIGEQYQSPARWNKAIQHLREDGKLDGSPRDIGPIIKEIPQDILAECKQEISDALFKWAWPQIARLVVRGFPEYYKEELMKDQFRNDSGETEFRSGEGLEGGE